MLKRSVDLNHQDSMIRLWFLKCRCAVELSWYPSLYEQIPAKCGYIANVSIHIAILEKGKGS